MLQDCSQYFYCLLVRCWNARYDLTPDAAIPLGSEKFASYQTRGGSCICQRAYKTDDFEAWSYHGEYVARGTWQESDNIALVVKL